MSLEDHYRALRRARDVNDRPGEVDALLGLGRTFQQRGDFPRARRALADALRISEGLIDPDSTGQILLALGEVQRDAGRLESARVTFQRALETYDSTGDEATLGWIHGELGGLFKRESRYREAMHHLREALPRARRHGEMAEVAWTLAEMGEILTARGALGAARRRFEEALSTARVAGDRREEAWILGALGDLGLDEGREREAEAAYLQGIDAYVAADDVEGETSLRLRLGDRFREVARDADAEREYRAVLDGARRLGGDAGFESAAHGGLGMMFAAGGDFASAHEHFAAQLEIVRANNDRGTEPTVLIQLGLCAGELGRPSEAQTQYRAAAKAARRVADVAAEARATGHAADLDRDQGHNRRALRRYTTLLAMGRTLGDPELVQWALGGQGEVHDATGDLEGALGSFEALLDVSTDHDPRGMVEYAHAACGRVLVRMARYPEALDRLERALELSRRASNRPAESFALASLALLRASDGAGDLQDMPEAVALAERAVRLSGRRDPVCLETLAQLYLKSGNAFEARRVVREALDLPDLSPGMRRRLDSHLSGSR